MTSESSETVYTSSFRSCELGPAKGSAPMPSDAQQCFSKRAQSADGDTTEREDDFRSDLVLNPVSTRDQVLAFFHWRRLLPLVVLLIVVFVLSFTVPKETFRRRSNFEAANEDECKATCKDSQGPSNDDSTKTAITQVGGVALGCDDVIFEYGTCRVGFVVPVYHTMIVIGIFLYCVIWVVLGGPPEIWLPMGAVILALLKILPPRSVFAGLSGNGVLTLAVLFPLATAVQETRLLDIGIGYVLGESRSLILALMRMMFAVALLSSILSNTATVALMIPVLVGFARRINIHPGKLLMPLSYASQLGGSMTKVGSSHCVILADSVFKGSKQDLGEGAYDMGMFDLAPCGAFIALVVILVIAFAAKTPLLQHSMAPEEHTTPGYSESEMTELVPDSTITIKDNLDDNIMGYRVEMVVQSGAKICGQSVSDAGIERLPGVKSVKVICDIEGAGPNTSSMVLRKFDVLEVWAEAKGIVAMRQVVGLEFANNSDLMLMGTNRRKRKLYEVALRQGAPIRVSGQLWNPSILRFRYRACLLAGPKQVVVGASTEDPNAVASGDVYLLEIMDEEARSPEWLAQAVLISEVQNSSPVRLHFPVDTVRRWTVLAGMLTLVGLAAIDAAQVDFVMGALLLLAFFLVIQAITVETLFRSIKVDILFTIVGALAFGTALTQTGVVDWLARHLLERVSNSFGIYCIVYVLAAFLGFGISNSAVVAILGPMLVAAKRRNPALSLQGMTWLLAYAAGTCFISPLGYQTNLMVIPDGKYTYGDFAKFGVFVQLTHMIVAVSCVLIAVEITG